MAWRLPLVFVLTCPLLHVRLMRLSEIPDVYIEKSPLMGTQGLKQALSCGRIISSAQGLLLDI